MCASGFAWRGVERWRGEQQVADVIGAEDEYFFSGGHLNVKT